MKQKKNLWINLLFAAVVLVIAGVLFYLRSCLLYTSDAADE